MTYICIKCRKTWGNGGRSGDYSGGLCEDCTLKYVRKKQKNQGFDDCYKRAVEVCSRDDCSYWHLCNKELLG
jgi:hypothetical protein